MPKQWMPNWSMPKGSRDHWTLDYEVGRPGWPIAVTTTAELEPTAAVLDLGAGTGKLTRELIKVFERVVAVEPAKAMRRVLVEMCPEADVRDGNAEHIPIRDASVDAVFVAQAFHTFDGERALPEMARVLRPRGVVVLIWNLPAGPWTPSAEAAEEILRDRMPGVEYIPLDLGGPDAASGWQPSIAESPFEPFRASVLPNPQMLDRHGLVSFYATMGWLADLPDEERLPLLDAVRSRLTADRYERLWETHIHWAHRRPAS